MLNKNFIDYSVKLLIKDRTEHFFTFFIFTFIVTILSSVLFISDSIKYDLLSTLGEKDQIIVTNKKYGKYASLFEKHIDDIIQFNGVENVFGKVDGYYHFAQGEKYIHIIADDSLDDETMVISKDVKDLFNEFHYEDEINFLTINGRVTKKIDKTIDSNILSNNTIFVNSYVARQILEMDENEYSYLTVWVPNENEIDFISRKIMDIFPHVNAMQRTVLEADFRHIFYYKGGIFMIVYIVSMISFFILLKNQVSSIFGDKKREIAVLRSIGFSISDIILLKFLQNSVVSISAFLTGIIISYFFVFVLNAPILKTVFVGEGMENLVFTPFIDIRMICLMFLFTVVPYLAFIIIPSWKVAIEDISEIMK